MASPCRRDIGVLAVSPVNLEDGRRLMWHPPQPVAFNLVEAKRYQDRGVRTRLSIMGNLTAREEGYQPGNTHRAIDCLSDLAAAVLFSFTAVESLANHAIEMLADETVLEYKGRTVPKAEMTRSLGIDEKLKRVMPMIQGAVHIAGTETWGRYQRLKFLRDELLHVKQRGYDSDPDERTAYDRLMVGEGDTCADDAHTIVDAAWPGWLPDHVQEALGNDPAARPTV